MNDRTAATLDLVRTLPTHTITATLRNQRGNSTRTFSGALLYDFARAEGLTPRPPSIAFSNYYFVVEAEDGFRVTLSYFEVTPRATDKQVLLAYEQDGELLRAGVRLVVPGDDLGGRSVSGVVGIHLCSVPSVEPQESRPASTSIELGGLLERASRLDLSDLSSFPLREVMTLPTPRHGGVIVPPRRYTGPLLWDLIELRGQNLTLRTARTFCAKSLLFAAQTTTVRLSLPARSTRGSWQVASSWLPPAKDSLLPPQKAVSGWSYHMTGSSDGRRRASSPSILLRRDRLPNSLKRGS
jgi:hypothetical protein